METQTDVDSHDLRLNVYFQNKRIREHLIRVGLINRKGVILPVPPKDERKKRKPKIPPAITNYMHDEERKRRRFLQNYFDLAVKRERVKQIRESKHPRSRPKSLCFLDATDNSNSRKTRTHSSGRLDKRSGNRVTSSRPLQLSVKNLLPTRPTTAKSRSTDDNCKVTLIYYGPPNNTELKSKEADEILVMQQHNGGENLSVFKGFVKPNQIFSFQSHRHPDYPFALAIYINGLIDTRISVCCEYKHKHNVRLGSKYGLFGIYDVEKSKPCTMCRFEQRKKEILAKPTASPYQRSGRTTEFSPSYMLRAPLVTPEKKPPRKVNRISTLAQASETSTISPSSSTHSDDEKLPNVSIHTEPIRKTSTSTSSSSDPFSKKVNPHHSSEPIISKRDNDTDKSTSTLVGDESDDGKQKLRTRISSAKHNRQRLRSSSDRSPSLASIHSNKNEEDPVKSRSSSSSSAKQSKSPSNRSLSFASIHSNKNEEDSVKSRSSSTTSGSVKRLKSPSISNDSFKFIEDKPPSRRSSIHSNKSEQNRIRSRPSSNTSNQIENFTHNDNRLKSPIISNNSFKMTEDTIYNKHLTKTPSEKSNSEHSRPASKLSNQSERLNRINGISRTPTPPSNAFKLLADLVPVRPDSATPSERSSSSTSIHLPTNDNRSSSSSNSTVKQSPSKNNDDRVSVRKLSSSSSDEQTQSNMNEKRMMSLIPIKSPSDSDDNQEQQSITRKQRHDSDDEFM